MNEFSDDVLDAFLVTGDPRADRYVENLLEGGRAPETVRALVSSLGADQGSTPVGVDWEQRAGGELPDWADFAAVERAQAFFEREYEPVMTVLGFAALPESYCNAGVARVLGRSALVADPARRVHRTAEFVAEVMRPGGLVAGGRGRWAVQRVRLLHAALRVAATDDLERLGDAPEAPLNQEDMAGTLLTLGWLTAIRLPRLGVRVSSRQAYDFAHAWNVIGWLLGVDARLLPGSGDSAATLAEAIRRRRYRPTAEGRALTRALIDVHGARMAPADARATMRQLLGDELADMAAI